MSTRWPGSLISPTAPVPTGGGAQDSAPGVWTIDQADQYIATQTWPGTGIPDPQFQYVTALLHGDGTNGGQNNTFLDSSSNNFSITRNGNTTQGSFSPYGSNWSNYFDGTTSNSRITFASSTVIPTSTSATWTVECWINPVSTGASGTIWGQATTASGDNGRTGLFINSAGVITYAVAETGITINSPAGVAFGQWTHIAITANASTYTMYINGTNVVSGYNAHVIQAGTFRIGALWDGDGGGFVPYRGYVSNLRAVHSVVYTSNFTPSTVPLTAITNTQLLTCQSNRFKDNSSNNFSITIGGSPSVQRFSPFQSLATYQTAVIGGSGYFDGTGDYLVTPSNTAFNPSGQDITVSFWMYATAYQATFNMLFEVGNASANDVQCALLNTGELRFQVGGVLGSQIFGVRLNTWHYVTCVKSGTNFTVYLDNVAGNTVSLTASSKTQMTIGANGAGGSPFTGYIANFRYIRGSAIVPTTIPSAPLTAITNTSLLLNYTNGAIFDSDASNNLETVGNAQISTSVVKYGTGSMAFDGTGDNLKLRTPQPFIFGTGNFTVEGWVYFNSVATAVLIGDVNNNTGASVWSVLFNSASNVLRLTCNASTAYSFSWTPSANTWFHFAISRAGTSLRAFINGNQIGATATSSDNIVATSGSGNFYLGSSNDGALQLNGYLDDIRVTTGYARYWYNFQPPTAPFPNYGGVLAPPVQDPEFEYVTLLLNGDGTNGAQNNTFLDSSTNNFTITRNGNTTQGSFSPYGTLWSNRFDGSGSFLRASVSALSSSSFTVEGWVFYTGASNAAATIYDFYNALDGYGMFLTHTSAGNLAVQFFSANTGASSIGAISTSFAGNYNAWIHVAVSYDGSTYRMFINGTSVGTPISSATQVVALNGLTVGARSDSAATQVWNGNISNLRYVTGAALYTSNFTPTTAPLGIAGSGTTRLLTCQSNRFIDNSSSPLTLTVTGTPSVQRFSPFNPTASYSTSVIGGSGYFDGSGDYLSVADNANLRVGSGDFTIDFWYYPTSSISSQYMFLKGVSSDSYVFQTSSAGSGSLLSFWVSNGASPIASGGTLTLNAWNYLTITRSGSTVTIYKNGVSVATGSNSTNFSSTATLYIGTDTASVVTGYMSDFRIIKGSAVVPSGAPTAPLAPITNTQLLTNFTNAGIPDLAMQNNLETVGNAQVSTSVKKYGTGSLAFDGSGDYLLAPNRPTLPLAGGSWTVEFWLYPNSVSVFQWIAVFNDGSGNDTNYSWTISILSDARIRMYSPYGGNTGVYQAFGPSTISTGQWYHVAVTYDGANYRVFINGNPGTAVAGGAMNTIPNGRLGVGADTYNAGTNALNGYIDDLRVTRGIARYVQPFTPPTQALQTF
jgi:hypothetical protein